MNDFFYSGKGQLMSKCPYEMIVSSKLLTKLFLDFCPENFLPSCGLPVGFFIYDITGSLKSFQDAPRKLQKILGQDSRNIFVGILEETDFSY